MSTTNKKLLEISKEQKKVSSKGLKNIINAISRKIFSKVPKSEVEYGQTLSKKRRKNCVLKSVSSLSTPEDSSGFLIHSPYHINFQFCKNESYFRGSVLNFQKIDIEESCCEKCTCALKKSDSFSRFSISSDSACDVSSESSCDDLNCKFRKLAPKIKKKMKKKSKSAGDISKNKGSTVENFIRIHKENFQNTDINLNLEPEDENFQNSLLEWTQEEPNYESLVAKVVDEADYDILVTRANYRVVEPSYENLKLIENLYEMPLYNESKKKREDSAEYAKDKLKPNKTYDEVIESLKLWHMSSKNSEECQLCSCCGERIENEYTHCVEGYESLENDFNNDIEEFCC